VSDARIVRLENLHDGCCQPLLCEAAECCPYVELGPWLFVFLGTMFRFSSSMSVLSSLYSCSSTILMNS